MPEPRHRPRGDWHRGEWRREWGRQGRPPWWPEGEAWPPEGPGGWRLVRRRFMARAFGFALLALIIMIAAVGIVVWALSHAFSGGPPAIVAALVGLILVALFARAIVRGVRGSAGPVADLMAAASRVEAGDYSARVAETGPRDVRRLASAFNAMSARLEHDEAERRQLLADVSHELRTPLSVIQGNVEGILDGLYPADRAHLEPILEETALLERLVEDLRTLSLSETGSLQLHPEPTDLEGLLADIVAGFGPRADAAGVTLRLAAAELPDSMELDQARIRQVIGNLLENALRFTPRGGLVSLEARRRDGWVELVVRDSGAGIEPEALERIFDRFYRAAESRGSGLGLPIARSLVEAHGGTISAESEPGQGTVMRVLLPDS
ncbi:MAG TPA: ATP-binding protein [Candidatus Limnocylindria bacterium]|nr:ATP-binding protein [Candidatus Limnocylindria bacterium]